MKHLDKTNLRYPNLWRGCVGAWAPLLGPSGTTLRDNSGLGNHGTLTGMDATTDWVVGNGQYALEFDGVDDHVPVGSETNDGTSGSMSAWISTTSAADNLQVLSRGNSTTNTPVMWLGMHGGQCRWFVRSNASAGPEVFSGGSLNTGQLVHIGGSYGDGQSRVYVNGRLMNSTAYSGGAITLNTATLGAAQRSSFGQYFVGKIFVAMSWNRLVTPSEFAILGMRPGIAHETTTRRSPAYVAATGGFQPAWATQRSRIIGVGV